MRENMENLIRLLREQTVLCRRLAEIFEKLILNLKENSTDILDATQNIEKILLDINKNVSETQNFLQRNGFKDFSEFLVAQEKNIQRDVAERLLTQSKNLQMKLKQQISTANMLVESGESFVNFNLNLMSRTQADTYGSDSLSEGQSNRRIVEYKC